MPILRPILRNVLQPPMAGLDGGGGPMSFKGLFRTNNILSDTVVPYGTATINEKSSAGTTITLSVDNTETFFGRPSTKCAITGVGSGTLIDIGVSTAAINLSAGAQDLFNKHLLIAVKTDGANTINTINLYLGDGTYANFRNLQVGSFDTASGWRVFEAIKVGATSTTGTPIALSLPQRAKVRFTTDANVAAGNVWISSCVAVPHPRPTVVFTCDDGYSEWTWLKDQAKARGIPITFGVSTALLNTGGYLTDAQAIAIGNDSSGLYEIANHSNLHSNLGTLGLSAYVAQVETARSYITSTLGLDPYAAALHMYVNGEFSQALIDQLVGLGYHSCRQVGTSLGQSAQNGLIAMGAANALYNINVVCNLENTQTLTTVQNNITAGIQGGTVFIMGHRFAAAAAADTWINGYDATYGVLDLLDWLAAKRVSDGWQIMKWSDWARQVAAGGSVV